MRAIRIGLKYLTGRHICNIIVGHRGVEQLAARRAHNLKVTGSSPVPATKYKEIWGLYCLRCFISKRGCLNKVEAAAFFLSKKYDRQVPKNLSIGVKLNYHEKLYTYKSYNKNNFISIDFTSQRRNNDPGK